MKYKVGQIFNMKDPQGALAYKLDDPNAIIAINMWVVSKVSPTLVVLEKIGLSDLQIKDKDLTQISLDPRDDYLSKNGYLKLNVNETAKSLKKLENK